MYKPGEQIVKKSRKLCTFKDFKVCFMIEPYVTIIYVAKFRKCMALVRFRVIIE